MFETMVRVATVLATQPSPGTTFLAIYSKSIIEYMSNRLGVIPDCYIAEIWEEWEAVQLFRDSMQDYLYF